MFTSPGPRDRRLTDDMRWIWNRAVVKLGENDRSRATNPFPFSRKIRFFMTLKRKHTFPKKLLNIQTEIDTTEQKPAALHSTQAGSPRRLVCGPCMSMFLQYFNLSRYFLALFFTPWSLYLFPASWTCRNIPWAHLRVLVWMRLCLCWSECFFACVGQNVPKSPCHLNYRPKPYRVLSMTPAHTASFYGQLPALKVSTTVLESLKLWHFKQHAHAANRIPAEDEPTCLDPLSFFTSGVLTFVSLTFLRH